jgi:hypothetical protein
VSEASRDEAPPDPLREHAYGRPRGLRGLLARLVGQGTATVRLDADDTRQLREQVRDRATDPS